MPSPSSAGQLRSRIWATVTIIALLSGAGCVVAWGAPVDASGTTINIGQPTRTVPALAQSHQARGDELSLAGDVEGAIAEYREALRIDPDFYYAHQSLGHALRSKGQLEEAIVHYRAALMIEQGYVPAHYALGLALVQKGDLDQAIAHLHIARQLAPKDAAVRIALSGAMLKWGDSGGAIAQAREALNLSPENYEAHLALGRGMVEKGMLAEAIAEFEAAAKNNDKSLPVQLCLGTARAGKGDWAGAADAFKKATELNPASAEAHNNLAAALLNADKADDAISEMQKASALEPGNAGFLRNLAGAQRGKKDLEGSVGTYHDALRIDPKDPSLHEGVGLALLDKCDLDGAIDTFSSLMASDPSDDDVEKALAIIVGHFVWSEHVKHLDTMRPEAYVLPRRIAINSNPIGELDAQMARLIPALEMRGCQKGGRTAFIKVLEDVRAVEPVVNEYSARISRVVDIKAGGVDIARPTKLADYLLQPLLKAGKIKPDAPNDLTPDMRKAVCAIAIALQHGDDLTESLSELQIASKMQPNRASLHNNVGRALMTAARTSEALAEFQKAIKLVPDLAEAHYNAGVALGILGNMPAATAELQIAAGLVGEAAPAPLYNYLGIAALENTEIALARSNFEHALRLDADFAPAKYNLGLVAALEASSLPLAKTALTKSRDYAPFGSKFYELRGEFIVDEKIAPALDALLAAGTADEGLKSLYHYYGVELCLQPANAAEGISGVAVVHDTNAVKGLAPDCTTVHNNLGVVMAAKKDYDGAEKMFAAAIAERPDYALAHWNLGQVLLRAGKAEDGQKELNLAARIGRGQKVPYILPFSRTRGVAEASLGTDGGAQGGVEATSERGERTHHARRPRPEGETDGGHRHSGMDCCQPAMEGASCILRAFHVIPRR